MSSDVTTKFLSFLVGKPEGLRLKRNEVRKKMQTIQNTFPLAITEKEEDKDKLHISLHLQKKIFL